MLASRVRTPLPVPLSVERLHLDGAYLLDNGRIFVLWLGRSISPDFLQHVLPGLHTVSSLPITLLRALARSQRGRVPEADCQDLPPFLLFSKGVYVSGCVFGRVRV